MCLRQSSPACGGYRWWYYRFNRLLPSRPRGSGTQPATGGDALKASGTAGRCHCHAVSRVDLFARTGPDCFILQTLGCGAVRRPRSQRSTVSTTTQYRQSFIVRRGKLVPVPQGFYLMVPGSLWSFAASPILSWRGKLRMALDLVLPRRTATADESPAHFVTRRLGREALWRIAQPMIGGIYTGDPEHLSLQATMPQFLEMEQQHGSLIRAMWHNQRVARQHGPHAGHERSALWCVCVFPPGDANARRSVSRVSACRRSASTLPRP